MGSLNRVLSEWESQGRKRKGHFESSLPLVKFIARCDISVEWFQKQHPLDENDVRHLRMSQLLGSPRTELYVVYRFRCAKHAIQYILVVSGNSVRQEFFRVLLCIHKSVLPSWQIWAAYRATGQFFLVPESTENSKGQFCPVSLENYLFS